MRNRIRPILSCLLMLTTAALPARAQSHDETWVIERVRQVKASDTTGWRKIPWVASLADARKASGEEKKPVFLFTHDGNIETGRC